MDDLLNLLKVQDKEYLTGTWYERDFYTNEDKGEEFQYSIVDESDRTYTTILNTLKTAQTLQTIKTYSDIPFKENQYVVTQEGEKWQISGVIIRLVHQDTEEALRFFKATNQTQKIIRLIKVDNFNTIL